MEGGISTPFKEYKKGESLTSRIRIHSVDSGFWRQEGYIYINKPFWKFFPEKYVSILFDKESNLLALKPSKNTEDYIITYSRVYCAPLLRKFKIPSQHAEAQWDEEKKYLIAKIKRE